MTETTGSHAVSDEALDVLFRKARSYNAFLPGEISDHKLQALYDLVKWGPTTANSQPQRILFLRSQAAKHLVRRIDDKPVVLDLLLLGGKCFHSGVPCLLR